ncbi:3-oxoadipate enol-lactonase [Glaciimonas immobilis]|uniref:3-oxoadipate enol-lactonase n=1 Tax=Glaciimonas immobilis TaxID=728004 RepID=A0A840RSP3_9BURK|nr:3-oxoadipate enol-lactonase [Glaciimonas immobilis]KAF3997624.1 3-oxoadipate enol-lactonase [Glaciimonas immobilis]MBB5200673.1 3-oxoadipate enol-lactonase [Glaciimonas immobilis]
MPLARINQTDIFFLAEGNPCNPAIVFSNSLGTDHAMWQAQAEALVSDFYVIRYDTRGHGQSASPKGPYQLQQLGQDVIALLDFLGIDKAHFCGLSMGGVTGQWLGIHAPQRVEKLVVSNTAAKVGTTDGWLSRAHAVRAEGLNAIADSAASRWFSPAFVENQSPVIGKLIAHLRAENPEGYASCCEALASADLRDQIHAIPNATLIIAGQYDPVTTESDAVLMQQKIKDSTIVVLPASHISNVEAEHLFTEALANFLKV